MYPIVHAYKLRLTNLSQGNRSLKLGSLSPRKDVDLCSASFVNKMSTEEILTRLVAGKTVELMRTLNPRDEATNLLDTRLNKVFREVTALDAETGAYDLFLGYPFVEGKFLDGNIARCPVVLIPVRLERDFQGGARWRVSIPENEGITLNKTFFLALEKFMQIRLPKEFWEEEFDHQDDLQAFLNQLYAFFRRFELPLNFNSELFQFKVTPFIDKNAATLEMLPVGELKFHPNAVLGLFPQSDSALLQDYETIERQADVFPIKNLLQPEVFTTQVPPSKESDRFFITPVDQSQEAALLAVRSGKSVVVHGPPGTGKSQVILNLIADALAQGQRVLVCSQKRAALDVVYQRLADLGLGDFAALVHDFRADRSRIFHQIAKLTSQLEQARSAATDVMLDKWLRDFRHDARRLDEFNQYFDELQDALTRVSRFGLSPHQLYLLGDPRKETLPVEAVANRCDYADLKLILENYRSLKGYLSLFHKTHPWKHRVGFSHVGLEARQATTAKIIGLRGEIESLKELWQPCLPTGLLHNDLLSCQELLADWQLLSDALSEPDAIEQCNHVLMDGISISETRKQIKKVEAIGKRLSNSRFLDDFPWSLIEDLEDRYNAFKARRKNTFRFLSIDWLKGRWYVARIIRHKGQKWTDENLEVFENEFDALIKLYRIFKDSTDLAFFKDMPVAAPWSQLQEWCARKDKMLDALKLIKAYKGPGCLSPMAEKGLLDETKWLKSKEIASALNKYVLGFEGQKSRWATWLHPQQIGALMNSPGGPDPDIPYIGQLRDTLERDFDSLRDLDKFMSSWDDGSRNLMTVLTPHLESGIDAEGLAELVRLVENSFYVVWTATLEQEMPILSETTSPRMHEKRDVYGAKVSERQASAAELIRARLLRRIVEEEEVNRLGNPVTYREITRQVQKQRRLWPMRKLIQTFWGEGLDTLLPCWMASPESVAAIFPMEKDYFDLVIFDEASQCYVERALPVILRGKTVVVAGDDKQLQPFDLYRVKVEESEEAFRQDEMAMEVESVLDLAKGVYPEVPLRWHYRSSEEALIRFSNEHFYENRLLVMPPAQINSLLQPPIEFRELRGIWEHNSNKVEAEAAVSLVEEVLRLDPELSIGIVTFNFHQMELIQDLVEQRIQSLDIAFDADLKERWRRVQRGGPGENSQGLFVKNIENVQGDERDVIIFSTGYAPNPAGKLVVNFGLLSQRGGENRLNVAVTRARKKIYILCSFDPDTLPVEDSLNDGPKLFKRYLQYARSLGRNLSAQGATGTGSNSGGPNVLANHLAIRLREKGMNVEESIGGTAYRIDLAIRDDAGRFVLGIECEGNSYFSGRSAKEREVYRWRLLSSAGWKMHRVWSRAYFLNPEAVVEEITALAKEAGALRPE